MVKSTQPDALVGTPGPQRTSETVDGEVMSISPVGSLDANTLRRQAALDMAIDARAREAERDDVLDVAARYDDFLRGDVAAS